MKDQNWIKDRKKNGQWTNTDSALNAITTKGVT